MLVECFGRYKYCAIVSRNHTKMTISEPIEYTVQSVKHTSEYAHIPTKTVKRNISHGYDTAQAVKRNPGYGYDGEIDNIRKTDYAHLGGAHSSRRS